MAAASRTSSIADALSPAPPPAAAATAAEAEVNKQAALLFDKHIGSQELAASAPAGPCANPAGAQGAEQQHKQQLVAVQDSAVGSEDRRGVAFAEGEQLIMSSGRSKQVVLQVEQFIARGGIADLYKVKLLQQQASGTSTDQPAAAAAGTANPAAAPSSSAAKPLRAAAALKHGATPQQQLLIGQSYALKVVRSLETFPAHVVEGKSNTAFLQRMRRELLREWQVLQDLATCPCIINAYSLGQVTAAGASTSTAGDKSAGAAAGSDERQQQQHQSPSQGQGQQQQELDSTHAGLEAPVAALVLPCILMEFADGGCAWDAVYRQHGRPTPLPADEAWQVVHGVVQGLREMHRLSYIHRDVKLQNVLKVSGKFGSR
jgi:serine/threonine protein kinase